MTRPSRGAREVAVPVRTVILASSEGKEGKCDDCCKGDAKTTGAKREEAPKKEEPKKDDEKKSTPEAK